MSSTAKSDFESDSIESMEAQLRETREHLDTVLKRLDAKRTEVAKYQQGIETLLKTHEVDSEAVNKLKDEVGIQAEDVARLQQEIQLFQHTAGQHQAIMGYQSDMIGWLDERASLLQHHVNLLNARFEAVLKYRDAREEHRVSVLRRMYESEMEKRRFLQKSMGWKLSKALGARLPQGEPIDPEAPCPVAEPVEFLEGFDPGPSVPGRPAPLAPEIQPSPVFPKREGGVARRFHSGLDAPQSKVYRFMGYKAHVGGWCFDEKGRPARQVWVSLGSQRMKCAMGRQRQDVVAMFRSEVAVDPACGFSLDFDTGPGVNFIQVSAEFQDGTKAFLYERIIHNLGVITAPKGQLDQDYQTWIECFDSVSASDEHAILKHIDSFQDKPLISVLLPVYNTDERFLAQAIESVMSQYYTNWELCIADDASPDPRVRRQLEAYAKRDSRIKVVFREKNGHISAATNSALELATGSYCALLDHDDLLPPHALYHVAVKLNEQPDTDLIFSDEDKIDEEGHRFDPYFKSDWNLDLFLTQNCVSHLGVYRTSILRDIGGFTVDLFGSQDWDLALRFIARSDPSRIHHIPRVLYHWRYTETSTAHSIDSKPYAVVAGKRAIEAFIRTKGWHATVSDGPWQGAFRVKFGLTRPVQASILIPTRNQMQVTRQCIDSILEKTAYRSFEIVLLNNQSDEPEMLEYLDTLKRHPQVHVSDWDHPFNFSAINNHGAEVANGEVLVFLNNDIEVTDPEWLEELVSQTMRPEIGAVGARLLYPDHTVQHAGVVLGVGGIAVEAFKFLSEWDIGHMGRAHLPQWYSAVTGACLATRKEVFVKAGGFNTDALAVAYNDVDYCLRLKRDLGLHTLWTPYARLIHHESVSRGYDITPEKKQRIDRESRYMLDTWGAVIENDPYYNPNLTRNETNFFLAWPPRVDKPWKTAVSA